MRILGIDPGLRVTGFGIIEKDGSRLTYIASGCVRSDATASLNRDTHAAYFRMIGPRHDVVTVSALADAWRSNRHRQVAA